MDYQAPTELIKKVGKFLGRELPEEKTALINHIKGLEALRYELAEATAEQHRIVVDMRRKMLHPKDKEFTELDRNVMLDAHVSVLKKDLEFLLSLQEIIRDRIELAKVLLTIA